jgi:hypothetical protein
MDLDEFQALVGSAIADPDFERIQLSLREPNIFRALAVSRMEIRHSNFLAYLFDPQENHGLRDIVLRKLLRDIFADSRSEGRTLFDADILDLGAIEIRREWRNIDLLIVLPEDVIAIENKVDSSDHSNQLARYRKIIEENFQNKKQHFVYLTPFGNDPDDQSESDRWMNYSYIQISEIIERILTLYHESFAEKVLYYLRDYLTTLKRELLMNDDLNELAIKVYQTHRAAFDFIFENRPDPASQLYQYFEKALVDSGFVMGSRNKGYARFTSPALRQNLPKTGQGWPDHEQFLLEIDYYWYKKSAVVKGVIAPGDEALREKLHVSVKDLPLYTKPKGKQWVSFYIKKFSFVADDVASEDEAEIRKKVGKIVHDIKDDADSILSSIENSLGIKPGN